MRHHVLSALAGLAILAGLADSAEAQFLTGLRVGAGLSLQFDDAGTGIGVTADVRGKLAPLGPGHLGWVVDFSMHSFDDFNTVGYIGGIAYNFPIGQFVTAYGQFALGVETCCANTGWPTFQPGGGVDIKVSRKIDGRIGLDFRSAQYNGEWFHTPRLWFGVTFVPGRQ